MPDDNDTRLQRWLDGWPGTLALFLFFVFFFLFLYLALVN